MCGATGLTATSMNDHAHRLHIVLHLAKDDDWAIYNGLKDLPPGQMSQFARDAILEKLLREKTEESVQIRLLREILGRLEGAQFTLDNQISGDAVLRANLAQTIGDWTNG